MIGQRRQQPWVVVATRQAAALAAAHQADLPVMEAVSTVGLLRALEKGPALVVVDLAELVEVPEMPREAAAQALDTLRTQGVPVTDGHAFGQDSKRWLGEALLQHGDRRGVRYLPRRVVLVTNYSGGVGKTTLSLALARRFRERTGLGAAVIEAGLGGSSFRAYLEEDLPSLYAVLTQGAEPGTWEGAHVYPLEAREARLIGGDERLDHTLQAILDAHTLTVFDAAPDNPLWSRLLEKTTDVFVVATPREDALMQAAAMLHTLEAHPRRHELRVRLVVNQVRSTAERLQVRGLGAAQVKYHERRARALDGRLAEPLLDVLYWNREAVA